MPIISKIGARSWRVRAVFATMFVVLIIGAVSMIYPFALMLSGSVASVTDEAYISPIPRFWHDDLTLFQKYAESKHNSKFATVQEAWHQPMGSWRSIEPPKQEDKKYLSEFFQWRQQAQHWQLGHSEADKLFPINARLFREKLYEMFDGDIDKLRTKMGTTHKSWNQVNSPGVSLTRFNSDQSQYSLIYQQFTETRPIHDRIIINVDGMFWRRYLNPTYGAEIQNYNKLHQTHYTNYKQVKLTSRAPTNKLQRQDWETYVRAELPIAYIKVDANQAARYRKFLRQEYQGNIKQYNAEHKTQHKTFDKILFPTVEPLAKIDKRRWTSFIKDPTACQTQALQVYGPRHAFIEFLAKKENVPVKELENVDMPVYAADYHDAMANTSDLRWEFTTRNYKHVFQYILVHGRGIPNTLIYVLLAIGSALLVNPLASYALSRYNLPSTYWILLFCMATMAFPGEVTMIPNFLLMKQFPLWPLVAGGVTLVASVLLLQRFASQVPEMMRVGICVLLSLIVAVWFLPSYLNIKNVSLLNTFAALILPSMANGYFIFLLKGFFDSLPPELYEAAEIDGAGEWVKFWTITMSLSKPILAVMALSAFTGAYGAFMMALIIIPDQDMWTLMVWIFQLWSQAHPAVVYASLVVTAIPTFLVFALCQNIIIKGIVVPVEK